MRLYRKGDSGEPVRDIQGRLGSAGFSCEPDPTGEFAAGTRAAVVAFQRSRGLKPDGTVGPETWRVLVESGYRMGDRLLYHRLPMLRGDDVAELQRRLNALGFDAGKVDGIFGPETLDALLDFQSNRGMGEDGIAGAEVADELDLVERWTRKEGREGVRERQWLRNLPSTVGGQRILVDAFNRTDKEDASAWEAAAAAAGVLGGMGAHALMSRSADTRPPERVRAQRANRLGVDLVLSFSEASGEPAAVFFFASRHSRSHAGEELARRIGEHLGLGSEGRAIPMLKETRCPAVVVAAGHLDARTGRETALAVADFFAARLD